MIDPSLSCSCSAKPDAVSVPSFTPSGFATGLQSTLGSTLSGISILSVNDATFWVLVLIAVLLIAGLMRKNQ